MSWFKPFLSSFRSLLFDFLFFLFSPPPEAEKKETKRIRDVLLKNTKSFFHHHSFPSMADVCPRTKLIKKQENRPHTNSIPLTTPPHPTSLFDLFPPRFILSGASVRSAASHSYSAITTIMPTPNSRARISITDCPKLERPTSSSGSTVTVAM